MLATRREDDSRAGWAFLGFAVVLGVVTALTLVGLAVTAVSASLSSLLTWIVPLSTVLLVILGALLILGRNPFTALTTIRMPVIRHPLAQACHHEAIGRVAGVLLIAAAFAELIRATVESVG
jgi:cytochrome c-type biogenesis protein